jgi:hypothetical protein
VRGGVKDRQYHRQEREELRRVKEHFVELSGDPDAATPRWPRFARNAPCRCGSDGIRLQIIPAVPANRTGAHRVQLHPDARQAGVWRYPAWADGAAAKPARAARAGRRFRSRPVEMIQNAPVPIPEISGLAALILRHSRKQLVINAFPRSFGNALGKLNCLALPVDPDPGEARRVSLVSIDRPGRIAIVLAELSAAGPVDAPASPESPRDK